MEKTNFDLGSDEAALIFKADNSIEIVIPKMEDDETVDFDKNQNIFIALAIAGAADQDDFRQVIGDKLNSMLAGGAEGCDSGDGSGCGCCSGSCAPPTTDGDTPDD